MRTSNHLLVTFTILAFTLAPADLRAADAPVVLDVWPGVAPGVVGTPAPEQFQENKPGEKPFKKATNVSHPTLTVFRPQKEKDTGVAILICPGGGYKMLMMDYEGEDAAKWLNTIGVTGIVLKYRVPGPEGALRYAPALQDAQRSLSLVRSKAKEWGIDPARIGMLGFSAGGHLTAAASTNFDKRSYDVIDSVDQVSCRPDFAVAVYPGGIIQKDSTDLSPEIRVSPQTPPTFIAQATDDKGSENSVFLYLAIKRAGVPVEMHLYDRGGHGFGMQPSTQPCATWPQRCEEWMRSRGILGNDAAAK